MTKLAHAPTGERALDPSQPEEPLAAIFRMLGSAPRLAILDIFIELDYVTVFDLVDMLYKRGYPLEQPTVSHHLRMLTQIGLIRFFKDGLYRGYYCPHPSYIRAIVAAAASPRTDERCYGLYEALPELDERGHKMGGPYGRDL